MVAKRLDTVARITMGQAPEGQTYNTQGIGIPLLAGAGDFGSIHPSPKKFTTAPTKLCEPGDVILAIRASIGEKVIADRSYCLGRGVAALRATSSLHDRYLWHWLSHVTPTIHSKARGATFLQVNRDDIGSIQIELPPLTDQRRIADILDKADALRAKRRAALAQLDTLKQSIFLDMFGDPVREGWQMATVEDVAAGAGSIRTGPFGSQLLHSEFVDAGIAVLGIDNAVENEFRWTERRFITQQKYRQLTRYTVRPGDVLITLMGTCGRCAVVPDEIPIAINTKHLCCITVDRAKCLPEFLHSYFLLHPIARRYLRQTAKGAIMDGLNMGIIKEMPIPLAPIELQKRYRQVLQTLNAIRGAARASASELHALFASLQHRAFRGEL